MTNPEKDKSSEKWNELKNLLLEEETIRIETLEKRILQPEEFAKSISEVLADAVQNTSDKKRLSQKLYPIVEQSIYKSVQKNPESLADAIYPVMSPAIRKAINDAMRKITENVNKSVNSGLSAQTLKWRIQAMFSGQSFGEIVLKNSLVYQVTEVYLIHSDSGLLLAHLSHKEGDNPDGDMISGMLTAIRDFVGDSFKVDKSESLETIRVGEFSVIMEQGPHAILACVVKGETSMKLRSIIRSTIEEIHKEFGPELISFSGDTSNISDATQLLRNCLITELDKDDKPGQSKMKWVILLLGFFLFLFLGYRAYWGIQWKKLKTTIENANYEIIQSGRNGRNFSLLGVDAAGFGIDSIIDSCKIPRDRLKIVLVESASNSIEKIESRIHRILENDLNIGVRVELQDGHPALFIHGNTSAERVRQLMNWLPFFCEGYNLSFDDLVSDEYIALWDVKKDIESILLLFHSGSVNLISGQDYTIVRLNELLRRMDQLCDELNESWKLDICGSTDEIGTRRDNILLEDRRAFFIVDNLLDKSLERIFVSMAPSSVRKKNKIKPLIKTPSEWRHASFELTKVIEK